MIVTGHTPVHSTPPALPAGTGAPGGAGEGFAALLGRSQAAAQAPEAPRQDRDEADASEAPGDKAGAAKARGLPRPALRPAGAAPGAAAPAEATDEEAEARPKPEAGANPAVDLPAWLMAPPATVPAPATAAMATGGALPHATLAGDANSCGAAPLALGTDGAPTAPATSAQAAGGAAAPGSRAAATAPSQRGAQDTPVAEQGKAFAERLAEQLDRPVADAAPGRSETQRPTELAGAAVAAPSGIGPASPLPVPGRDAANPVAVVLPTATASPEFPQALGVQVSLLARDGVQHAELHLNPAETGPVSVQIVLDGTQARVEFGADLAATRDALQAGLPELAAALRDAGLTLSGGGVSQHARGRGEGGRGETPRDASPGRVGTGDAASGADTAARVVRLPVRAGGVDLYA